MWGSLYASAFLLLGTSLLRLSVFLRKSDFFGLPLSSEIALAAFINFCGYGTGLTLGLLGDGPGGVLPTQKWAEKDYPTTLTDAFCKQADHDFPSTYHSTIAARYEDAADLRIRHVPVSGTYPRGSGGEPY